MGDLDSQPGQDASQIIETTAKWSEKMYDMTSEEIKHYVDTNCAESGIIYIQYTFTQLGKDEEWLEKISRTLLFDKMKIKREVHLKRMHGSNLSPFSTEEIEAIVDLSKEPVAEHMIFNRFKLDIYDIINRDRIYAIGIDCSSGVGIDNNALTIVDPYTEKPVAEFKSPYISQPDFNRLVLHIMRRYTPRAFLCIERNNVGSSLIQHLMETEFRNSIYYETTDLRKVIDDKLDSNGLLKHEAAQRRVRGIYTGGESRKAMHKILESQVYEHSDRFITQNITSDISKLIKKGERIDHAAGFHDDSLMSYLMVLYVLRLGKSLHHFGFVRGLTEEDKERGIIEEGIDEVYDVLNNQLGGEVFRKERSVVDEQEHYAELLTAARRESQHLDMLISSNHTNGAFNMDNQFESEHQYTDMNLDFFDELND